MANARGGPQTALGKAASSQNAVKHGLTSARIVVVDGLEDPNDWRAFQAGIVQSLGAQPGLEMELAERLAALLWRLRRVDRFEAMTLSAAWSEAERRAVESFRFKRDGTHYVDAGESLDFAAEHRREAELVRDLPSAKAGDKIDAELAGAVVWAVFYHSETELDLEELAPTWPGVKGADLDYSDDGWDETEFCCSILPKLGEWTVGRVRTIAEGIAARDGVSLATLCRRVATKLSLEACGYEHSGRESARALAAEQADAALPRDVPAERVGRYEVHLQRQVSAVLRDLAALRAA